ncbi:DUF3658 domain-containing protein [Agrobacterium tumefaciens]|uniref:DUF3658 domain-containing protein n=1 Tax=Agrobacterium tumefaciens TaxID=358 RepID=UPI000DCFD5F7|nr:DUF1835 domain-containing protein [Agrobacterium tumefaciens]
MLHVVPSLSARGSLEKALSAYRPGDAILAFRDDLSCGPIASIKSAKRMAWWHEYLDWPETESEFDGFWEQVDAAQDRIVLWFGKYSSSELAFRLAWAAHMDGRPYDVIDVSDLHPIIYGQDIADTTATVAKAAALLLPEGLAKLIGSEQPASAEEDARYRNEWARLQNENAFFRIVTPTGLASADQDHFDVFLMQQADTRWRKAAYIVGNALLESCDPYFQTGSLMLTERLQTLVDQARLEADGDVYDLHSCLIRLPEEKQ